LVASTNPRQKNVGIRLEEWNVEMLQFTKMRGKGTSR
jgi:hypothetical protein